MKIKKKTQKLFLEKLPAELDEMECSECKGDCFVDCDACGGDGDIECPVCGGMGEKGVQERNLFFINSHTSVVR